MATNNGTLIRSDLTKAEYAEIRKQAIDKGQHVGAYVGAALRRGLLKRRAK